MQTNIGMLTGDHFVPREDASTAIVEADRRKEGLKQIVEGIKQVMLEGELADAVWNHWGRNTEDSRGRRRKVINRAAQAYEAGKSSRSFPVLSADGCRAGKIQYNGCIQCVSITD
jgi:hypothetical protein